MTGDLASALNAPSLPLDLPAECCARCHFGRFDHCGNLRCHKSTPRRRGNETFWPTVPLREWCGKFKLTVRP